MESSRPQRSQFTVRGVPASVERALRRKARREGRSLNAILLDALAAAGAVEAGEVSHDDLDDLIGAWVEDPEFDHALEAQGQVDPELWR